jgi:hypothetical protein
MKNEYTDIEEIVELKQAIWSTIILLACLALTCWVTNHDNLHPLNGPFGFLMGIYAIIMCKQNNRNIAASAKNKQIKDE